MQSLYNEMMISAILVALLNYFAGVGVGWGWSCTLNECARWFVLNIIVTVDMIAFVLSPIDLGMFDCVCVIFEWIWCIIIRVSTCQQGFAIQRYTSKDMEKTPLRTISKVGLDSSAKLSASSTKDHIPSL